MRNIIKLKPHPEESEMIKQDIKRSQKFYEQRGHIFHLKDQKANP
jgi:hypothetical protein